MADILNQMNAVTSTPEEAASHISGASIFDIGADVFKQQKDYLQPEVDSISKPYRASRAVAEYATTSPEHAALIEPDVDKFSHVDTQIKNLGDQLNGQKPLNAQILELTQKRDSEPDKFTEDDENKLMQLEIDAEDYRDYGIKGPDKYQETITAANTQDQELGNMDKFFTSVTSGVASFNAGLAKLPALGYQLYFAPANILRHFQGEEPIQTPDAVANNAAVKYFDDASKAFAAKVPELNASISEAIGKGNFANAGRIAAMQFAANAPMQAVLLASVVTGFGAVGLVVAGVITAAGALQEDREKGISPLRSLPGALAKGTFESAFESIGTMGMLKTWEKSMVEVFSKETASEVMKAMMKTLTHTVAGEANEEFLTSVAQDLTDYTTGVNPNAIEGIWQRAADAGILGGVSGLATTAPTGIATGVLQNIERKSDIISDKTMTQKALDTLQAGQIIHNVIDTLKTTEMNKYSPTQVMQVVKGALDKSGIKKFWFDETSLKELPPDQQEAFMKMVDPTGVLGENITGQMSVSAHKFIEFAQEYPTVIELAKMAPENPSIAKAEQFLKDKQAADTQRKEVLKKLGVSRITGEEKKILNEALIERNVKDPEILDENDYLNQPTFTEAVQKIMPEAQAAKYNADSLEVRKKVLESVKDAAVYEMDQVKDDVAEAVEEARIEEETLKLKDDPNLALVDRFAAGLKFSENFADLMAGHKKKGFSPFAVDPDKLPANLKNKYAHNEQLKKHKFFVKGGISLDESARLVGAGSGKNLLRILAQTPSRQDIIDRQVALVQKADEYKINDSINLDQTSFIKNLSNAANMHVQELKLMLSTKWASEKSIIKRIANSLPKDGELQFKARYAIKQTKIGDLNVNQFKVGERKAQKIAVNAVLEQEIEKAIKNKISAALNVELAKETHVAIAQLNRLIRFARQFNKADVIQELKDAKALDAANELLDVFHLAPDKQGTSKADSFAKWGQKVYENGGPEFTLPNHLEVIKQNLDEMTVEQALLVGDRLKLLLAHARKFNKLNKKHKRLQGIATLDGVASELHDEAIKAYDYDQKRYELSLKEENIRTEIETINTAFNETRNYMERTQHLLVKMDNDEVTGKWNSTFWAPLAESAEGEGKDALQVFNHFKEIVASTIGEKAFNNLASEFVEVPEFEKIANSQDGNKFSMLQLLVMNLNRGNDGNLQALERFDIKREVFESVLEKHLTREHMLLTQRIWDTFESYKERIGELEKKTKGTEPKWVESTPVIFKGEVFPGGYYPIMTQFIESKYKAKRLIGTLEQNADAKFRQNMYAEAMTDDGHTKARTGSDDVITLTFGFPKAISRVIHDLNFRETIMDQAKLLEHESVKYDLISVLGNEGYRNITDNLLAHIDEVENKGSEIADNFFQGLINYVGEGRQIMSIVGKISSVAIQTASLPMAIEKMGKIQGTKHMLATLSMFTRDMKNIKKYYDIAENLHPDIKHTREDYENGIVDLFSNLIPTKKNILTPVKVARDFALEIGFGALGAVDTFNKVVVVTAAYRQALNGDAPNIKVGDHEAAKRYASNIAELTQTHSNIRNKSPIQRNRNLKWMTYFYNDANNMLNNMISVTRKLKKQSKAAKDAALEGRIKDAGLIAAGGVAGVMGSMMIIATIKIIENTLHGVKGPFDDEEEDDPVEYAKKAGKYFLQLNVDAVLDVIPLVRDINYASEKYWMKKKVVDMPLDQTFGEFATTVSGLKKLLDFSEDARDINPTEMKSLAMSFGLLTHLPIEGFYKTFLDERKGIMSEENEPWFGETLKSIDNFIKKNDGEPKSPVPQEFVDQVKDIRNDMVPASQITPEVPENTLPTISQIVSKGKWDTQGPNGEVGIYQFTESAWETIRKEAPELGLTENGRLAKNPEQQERAMKWQTEKNSVELKNASIDSSEDTLLLAHILPIKSAIDVLKAPGDTKIKTMVGESFIKQYGLRNGMKVKEFKDWLLMKTIEAEDTIDKTTK